MQQFKLNGEPVQTSAHPLERLLDVLREECGLSGTKEGCGEGECGACTVLVDGKTVVSCLVPVGQVDGCEVTTIEGLREHPIQKAFATHGAAQCGICTPGMIMAAVNLPPRPSIEEVRTALAGNLCRCTGYEAIYRAIFAALGQSSEQDTRPEFKVLPMATGADS
jgi:aerobic-type carbon monoxide dehydrogenase small subunit (CoxS/CutS family)